MTLTQYEESVKCTLASEYNLTPEQAGKAAFRHCGYIAICWEHGESVENAANTIRIREYNFVAIKAETKAAKIEAAYKIVKKKLEELGCDTEKLLKNAGLDTEGMD